MIGGETATDTRVFAPTGARRTAIGLRVPPPRPQKWLLMDTRGAINDFTARSLIALRLRVTT